MNQVQKTKKIPERRCLGCNNSFPKKELLRIVRSPEGEISFDTTGKKSGRGAYICKKSSCFKKAIKSNRISGALETQIPQEIIDSLEKEISVIENDL